MKAVALVFFLLLGCGESDRLYEAPDASVTDLGVDREACRIVDEEWGIACCVQPYGFFCWRPG